MKNSFLASLVLLALVAATVARAQSFPLKQGMYEYVVRSVDGTVDSAAASVEAALVDAGWNLVGTFEPGAPEACSYGSRVIVGYRPAYGDVVMRANELTGAFGVLDRVNVFEDEDGVHVSVANQRSIIRTVLMNDNGYAGFVQQHMSLLRGTLEGAVNGQPTNAQYGQTRDRGYIGRTMGVMAGGSFDGKVEDIAVMQGLSLEEAADQVEAGLSRPGQRWGTGLSFRLDLPEHHTVLFGTTGTPLDSKSFEIVRAGSDDAREGFACPGLAHAAAYPLEIVAAETADGVAIRIVDSMYRMKMYFEDAGKIAFMKNMTMPGSIADEIKEKVKREGS